ncbi:MAG: toxin-antitoxin system YwqK family antitoxin [Saprospiraceae bacterium]|nr:toxin-antitoxin system YwqK family antitoxin [Saprospiraceae bacterium]
MIKSIYNWGVWMLIIILFSSCGDKVIITHYETGEKFEEYQYTGDSLKNGLYKRFSPGGILLEESMYVEGKLNGERIIYNEKGEKEVSEIYTNDVLNGTLREYYPNGKMKLTGTYTNNVLSGTVNVFYPSGKLKEEVQFLDNKEDGPFKEFHENGNIKWEGTYKDGDNEFGLLKEYNENGELIRKMMCDDRAICTTTWTIDGSHLKKKDS